MKERRKKNKNFYTSGKIADNCVFNKLLIRSRISRNTLVPSVTYFFISLIFFYLHWTKFGTSLLVFNESLFNNKQHDFPITCNK